MPLEATALVRGRFDAMIESGRGDLLIHVNVETPTKLDEEHEELLRRLAKLRGEERPPGKFAPGQQGFFSRLRDVFNSH